MVPTTKANANAKATSQDIRDLLTSLGCPPADHDDPEEPEKQEEPKEPEESSSQEFDRLEKDLEAAMVTPIPSPETDMGDNDLEEEVKPVPAPTANATFAAKFAAKGKARGKPRGKARGNANANAAAASAPAEAETAAPASPVAVATASGDVQCQNCKLFCSFQRCRIMSKLSRTWRCHLCSVKCTTLRRHNGTWPTSHFISLSKDSQPPTYFEIQAYCCLATSSLYIGWCINVSGPILCLQY
jgi:hypothetical protein